MKKLIEKINWQKGDGLIPAIVQDAGTGIVLMLGYMNPQSLKKTARIKKVWFYSRTKQRLWMKGEVSKNYLSVKNIVLDCDLDALLIQAKPQGPTCHTGAVSCFNTNNTHEDFLSDLYNTILDRKQKMPKGSYTVKLFKAGLTVITAKILEESVEVIQAAKKQTKQRLIEETCDILYHLLVLLVSKNITLSKISREFKNRKK